MGFIFTPQPPPPQRIVYVRKQNSFISKLRICNTGKKFVPLIVYRCFVDCTGKMICWQRVNVLNLSYFKNLPWMITISNNLCTWTIVTTMFNILITARLYLTVTIIKSLTHINFKVSETVECRSYCQGFWRIIEGKFKL